MIMPYRADGLFRTVFALLMKKSSEQPSFTVYGGKKRIDKKYCR